MPFLVYFGRLLEWCEFSNKQGSSERLDYVAQDLGATASP
jgi:hypothetical protein